ncbi:MAG: hypothetical protein IPM54_42495 [Polyangiaceae bacterium]|nr:hypothetical protein [Polyangiaceae bacterium]
MVDGGSEADRQRQVGRHRLTIEPPDLIYLHIDGDVDLEHIKAFVAAIRELPSSTKVYVLRDARKSGLITLRAREYVLKHVESGRVGAFISFGAPFHVRTMITMIAKAVRLLRDGSLVVGFTDTEAEARAWIDRVRAGERT